MRKSTLARTAGFVGALGVSATLVGFAATGTGAYFTDSHDGTINASTGQVQVNTSSTTLKFAGLLPGEYQTKTVDYTAKGSEGEDIWLVFPSDGSAEALTGIPGVTTPPAPLGSYGHLKIKSTGGAHFVSNNLANKGTDDHDGAVCGVDGNGWGGSTAEPATKNDRVPFCAPRNAILLQSGMSNGKSGHVNIEFGFTRLLTAPQASAMGKVAEFKIVATQHGIRPDNQFNTPKS